MRFDAHSIFGLQIFPWSVCYTKVRGKLLINRANKKVSSYCEIQNVSRNWKWYSPLLDWRDLGGNYLLITGEERIRVYYAFIAGSLKAFSKRCQKSATTNMKDEVRTAIKFLSEVLLRNSKVNEEQVQKFKDTLEQLMITKFQNHWHPSKPLKGNAFRCLNIDTTAIDPVLLTATKASGILPTVLLEVFPGGLALWVDPGEVSCRIGKGSICPLYGGLTNTLQQSNSRTPQRPLQHFNANYRQCSSQSNFKQSLFPRYQNNKENFEKYHWAKTMQKRTTEVF